MKTILQTLALCLPLAFFGQSTAQAQDIGIQFSKMPVGTKAHYRQSNGKQFSETYIGTKRGLHVIRSTRKVTDRGRGASYYYDSKGRLVHFTGPKGLKVIYSPYNCTYQVGKCQYKSSLRGEAYVNQGGSRSYKVETRKISGGYQSILRRVSGYEIVAEYRFSLGKYNLRKEYNWREKSGMKSIKLISVK